MTVYEWNEYGSIFQVSGESVQNSQLVATVTKTLSKRREKNKNKTRKRYDVRIFKALQNTIYQQSFGSVDEVDS